MILAIDIGNTNTVFGIYRDQKLVRHWRISTDAKKTADEYALVFDGCFRLAGIDRHDIVAIVIANVMPPVLDTFQRLCTNHFGITPFIVTGETPIGLQNAYHSPRDVGADRLVNAVAARHKYGLPVIIVDLGTATTIDAVSHDGVYLGGAILPGVSISLEALFERASKLPRIDLKVPETAIGKTTVHSMQSGVIFGTIGAIDEIVKRVKSEMEGEPAVIATGGLGTVIQALSGQVTTVDPFLTLDGLHRIYQQRGPH